MEGEKVGKGRGGRGGAKEGVKGGEGGGGKVEGGGYCIEEDEGAAQVEGEGDMAGVEGKKMGYQSRRGSGLRRRGWE